MAPTRQGLAKAMTRQRRACDIRVHAPRPWRPRQIGDVGASACARRRPAPFMNAARPQRGEIYPARARGDDDDDDDDDRSLRHTPSDLDVADFRRGSLMWLRPIGHQGVNIVSVGAGSGRRCFRMLGMNPPSRGDAEERALSLVDVADLRPGPLPTLTWLWPISDVGIVSVGAAGDESTAQEAKLRSGAYLFSTWRRGRSSRWTWPIPDPPLVVFVGWPRMLGWLQEAGGETEEVCIHFSLSFACSRRKMALWLTWWRMARAGRMPSSSIRSPSRNDLQVVCPFAR
ncbi:hypothetical protein DFH09DRAFT_228926 [Mycena vulgaris]|nr:hypothetical protein DFH09DRAFT_228926 [Mycena vulgaris]